MRKFRKASAANALEIANLYKQLVPDAPIAVLPERITEIASDKNTYLIVCEIGDDVVANLGTTLGTTISTTVVATALVTLCNDVMFTSQPFAIIENVIVDAPYQGQGIGRDLMVHIEAFCLAADCSKIMLLSSSDNNKAHDFYKAMGYSSDAKSGFIKKRRHFKNS